MTKTKSARKWREAIVWRWGFVVATVLCAGLYLCNVLLAEVRPSGPWGLSYGGGATFFLFGAALFAVRRRSMGLASRLNLGRSRSWLYFHLYGGCLFLLLVLMHSGFQLPQGALTWWLWGLSLWTTVSGLLGLLLQRWIPRVLASGLSIEVLYERIPQLINELRDKAERLVETCGEPVQVLYNRDIAPALVSPTRRLIYYLDITGGIQSRMRDFDYLRGFLSPPEREKLGELKRLYRTKLEIDAHYTVQQALRLWLYAHVPLSTLLVLFVVLHILAVLYY